MNIRKYYIDNIGPIPDDYEVHHIIPRHSGGDDTLDNLIALSKSMHKCFHLDLFNYRKDFRDLCAYHMIGYNFSEAHKVSSSEGGKCGGKLVYETGVGIFRDIEERRFWASMGGKVGGRIQKEQGLGIHGGTEEERRSWSSLGGRISGNFSNSKFQSDMGKRGGVKNKGSVWITDDTVDKKYTATMQKEKPIEDFLKENIRFRLGRKKRR